MKKIRVIVLLRDGGVLRGHIRHLTELGEEVIRIIHDAKKTRADIHSINLY